MATLLEALTNCRFSIHLQLPGESPIDAYFEECQGVQRAQEVIEFWETTPQKWGQASSGRVVRSLIPGNITCSNLVMRKCLTASDSMWKWLQLIEDGKWAENRKDGFFTICDQKGIDKAKYQFFRAWPTRYKISDVHVRADDLALEELELAVEELRRIP